jgi:hypothetical protein
LAGIFAMQHRLILAEYCALWQRLNCSINLIQLNIDKTSQKEVE